MELGKLLLTIIHFIWGLKIFLILIVDLFSANPWQGVFDPFIFDLYEGGYALQLFGWLILFYIWNLNITYQESFYRIIAFLNEEV